MFKKVLTMILPLLLSVGIFAQTRVAGTVADSGGEPLAGVAVFTQVGASTVSALTDEDGTYLCRPLMSGCADSYLSRPCGATVSRRGRL